MGTQRTWAAWAVVFFLAGCGAEAPPPIARSEEAITVAPLYGDALAAGWSDWSWATHNLSNGAPVAAGARSISVDFAPWTGLYLHHAGVATAGATHLAMQVNGGSTAGKALSVYATVGGAQRTKVPLAQHCAGGVIPANAWTRCLVPLSALGVANATIDGIVIQEFSGRTLSRTYVDEIALDGPGTAPAPTTPPPPSPSAGAVYGDAMVSPWQDSSWATRSLTATSPVAAGTRAISARMGAWQALYFTRPAFVPAAGSVLTLHVHGGASGGGAALRARAVLSGNTWTSGVDLGPSCEGGAIPAGRWARCQIPVSALAPAGASVTGIAIQEWRGTSLPTLYFDEVALGSGTAAPPPPAAPVAVSITRAPASADACGSVTFEASVSGASDPSVTWSVQEANGGTITAAGVYTAPALGGTYHVVATSNADPAKSAVAPVAVTERVLAVEVSPREVSLPPGGTARLTATVTTTCGAFTATQVVGAGGAVLPEG
jgi:hypothetical protein